MSEPEENVRHRGLFAWERIAYWFEPRGIVEDYRNTNKHEQEIIQKLWEEDNGVQQREGPTNGP